jgi:DNA-binding MarR family transcriptional regulator
MKMSARKPLAAQTKEKPPPVEPPPGPLLSRAQRQVLHLLAQGDCLWEIADDPDHYTVYNEKRGGDQRVRATLVATLAEQGWIRKRPNPQADRLDSWEITPEGQALLPAPKRKRRAGEPGSELPPSA